MTLQPPPYNKDHYPLEQWPTATEPTSTSLSEGQPAVGYPQVTGQAQSGYPGMPTGQAAAGYPGMPTGQAAAGYPGMPVAPVTTQPASQQTVVVNQQAAPSVVVVGPTARPSDYMCLSCCVYWCCNPIVGGIAFALSMLSSNAADDNRMDEARKYGKAACWTSIIGTFVTIGVVVAVIVSISATAARGFGALVG